MTSGVSQVTRQSIVDALSSVYQSHFKDSFPGVKDFEKIALAQLYYESHFNNNATKDSGSPDKDFVGSSVYSKILGGGNPDQIKNMQVASRLVYGLGQVRGSYLVRGGSRSGICEIERIRPDLAPLICVNPGQDVADTMIGAANISNAIIAALTILQGKFQAVPKIMKATANGYVYRDRIFSSRIEAAIGAYLGLGIADSNGTTSSAYASSIVGGKAFAIANNAATPAVQTYSNPDATQVATGPTTDSNGMGKVNIVGC